MNSSYESGDAWDQAGLTWSDIIAVIRRNKMIRIRKTIKSRRFTDQLDQLRQAYDGMNGNAMITAPTNPTLANYLLKLDDLDDKLVEIHDARTELAMLREQRNQLLEEAALYYAQLGSHVEIVAGDDRAIAESSGFEVMDDAPAAPAPLVKPANVRATTGADDGELDVRWDSDSAAAAFEVQTSPDPINGSTWAHGATVSGSRVTLADLPEMAKRWARVRAVRGSETGPWSDPSCAVVT